MIKKITIIMAAYSFLGTCLGYLLINTDFAVSLMLGSAIMIANLAGLAILWRLIFLKKSIALAAFVIIFKYLILGMILWSLASTSWLNSIGFIAGLASLVFAVVGATTIKSFSKK